MITPTFSFDAEANAYISEPFVVKKRAEVHIDLIARAPVITLQQETDGGFANYGESPKQSDRYVLHLTTSRETTIKLATPVAVTNCIVLDNETV